MLSNGVIVCNRETLSHYFLPAQNIFCHIQMTSDTQLLCLTENNIHITKLGGFTFFSSFITEIDQVRVRPLLKNVLFLLSLHSDV